MKRLNVQLYNLLPSSHREKQKKLLQNSTNENEMKQSKSSTFKIGINTLIYAILFKWQNESYENIIYPKLEEQDIEGHNVTQDRVKYFRWWITFSSGNFRGELFSLILGEALLPEQYTMSPNFIKRMRQPKRYIFVIWSNGKMNSQRIWFDFRNTITRYSQRGRGGGTKTLHLSEQYFLDWADE